MSLATIPSIHCDGADESFGCDTWDVLVAIGVRPEGWTVTRRAGYDEDLCPRCTAEGKK